MFQTRQSATVHRMDATGTEEGGFEKGRFSVGRTDYAAGRGITRVYEAPQSDPTRQPKKCRRNKKERQSTKKKARNRPRRPGTVY